MYRAQLCAGNKRGNVFFFLLKHSIEVVFGEISGRLIHVVLIALEFMEKNICIFYGIIVL